MCCWEILRLLSSFLPMQISIKRGAARLVCCLQLEHSALFRAGFSTNFNSQDKALPSWQERLLARFAAPVQAHFGDAYHLYFPGCMERLYVAVYSDPAYDCHLQQRLQERRFCPERHHGGHHHRHPAAHRRVLRPAAAHYPEHHPHRVWQSF